MNNYTKKINPIFNLKVDQQINIDPEQTYFNYTQFFTTKIFSKNLLTGKQENLKRKYGLKWSYKKQPSSEMRYYLKGVYEHAVPDLTGKDLKNEYVCVVEEDAGAFYLIGSSGVSPIKKIENG